MVHTDGNVPSGHDKEGAFPQILEAEMRFEQSETSTRCSGGKVGWVQMSTLIVSVELMRLLRKQVSEENAVEWSL